MKETPFTITIERNGFKASAVMTDKATNGMLEIISKNWMSPMDVLEHCLLNLIRNQIDKSIRVIFSERTELY